MELMLRRRALMGVDFSNMAKSKSGSFVGDGSKEVTLPVGFEPDVVVVDNGQDISIAGITGLYCVVIAKNILSSNLSHNSDTDTSARLQGGGLAPDKGYGDTVTLGAYRSMGIYENGVFTLTNVTSSPSSQYCFTLGQTYTWTAYKA